MHAEGKTLLLHRSNETYLTASHRSFIHFLLTELKIWKVQKRYYTERRKEEDVTVQVCERWDAVWGIGVDVGVFMGFYGRRVLLLKLFWRRGWSLAKELWSGFYILLLWCHYYYNLRDSSLNVFISRNFLINGDTIPV